MNHQKLINETIGRYADYPTVQRDMRRLLKYVESQVRMFLMPIIKDLPTCDGSQGDLDAGVGDLPVRYPL